MKDYTIVIQGPLDKWSTDGIENYKTYGDVLVSTWDNSYTSSDVKVIAPSLPDIKKSVGTISNFYYAICGMDNALQQVETKYFIRTRGDEVFENLDNLISVFEQDTNKFVCGNIFTRSWNSRPMHIGDHLYVAKTSVMRDAIGYLRAMYDGKKDLVDWAIQGSVDVDPSGRIFSSEAEVVLAKSFLHASGVDINKWYDKGTFLKYFNVVDINETKRFVASWQNGGVVYRDNFQNPHGVRTIEDV